MSESTEPKTEKAPSNNKAIMIGVVIGAFSIILGVGGAYFAVGPQILARLIPPAEAAADDHEGEAEDGHVKKDKGKKGKTEKKDEGEVAEAPKHHVTGLVVNIGRTSSYLLFSVAAVVSTEDEVKAVKAHELEIRDRLLTFFSARPLEEIRDVTLRDSLREQIKGIVSEVVPDVEVAKILFTQYSIQ